MMEKIISYLTKMIKVIDEDKLMAYAGQASLFVIISIVPCLSLLISILSFFIPTDVNELISQYVTYPQVKEVLYRLLDELQASSTISFLSISIVFVLWAASRGVSSIRAGLRCINGTEHSSNWVLQELKALAFTLILIAILVCNVVLVQFGTLLGEIFDIVAIADVAIYIGIPVLILVMASTFAILYAGTMPIEKSARKTIAYHFPGALIAAFAWIIFSMGYSLYIKFVPNVSYIYGGLTAVCLIMLWLYACMAILLLGAEINKLNAENRKKKDI